MNKSNETEILQQRVLDENDPHAVGELILKYQDRLERVVAFPEEYTPDEVLSLAANGELHSQHPLALFQAAHDVVETLPRGGEFAYLEIDTGRDQAALGIVTDDGIGRVFVLLVELGPGVETRFGRGLALAALPALHPGHGFCQQLEVAVGADQAATQ